jgi:plasmid stabilization system protein ParE
MTRRLVLRPQAVAELDEAAQFPHIHGSLRRAVLRRFPYSIVFAATNEEIVVLSVFHSSRDPKRWRPRK